MPQQVGIYGEPTSAGIEREGEASQKSDAVYLGWL